MTPTSRPLQGCIIALSGTFPGHSQSTLETDFINVAGASLTKTINEDTTHLITTKSDFTKPSAKVKQAQSHDVPIVKLAWLEDCLEQSQRLLEDAYLIDAPDDDHGDDASATKVNGKKRTASVAADDDSQSQPLKKAKATSTNGSQMQSQATDVKKEAADGHLNVAKSSVVRIPLDETCPLTHHQVYIDSSGVIYDASLNQTNAGKNNNKFYKLQV
jgi:poly [ADP-ribose] polymerase